jgi:signal peptidase I
MLGLMVVLAFTLIVSTGLSAFFLWLCARLLKAPQATFWRAFLAIVIVLGVGVLGLFAHYGLASAFGVGQLLPFLIADLIVVIVQLLLVWLTFARVFQTTFPRGILIWLVNLVPSVGLAIAVVVPLRLFIANAYTVPTNAMAPTIVGWHRIEDCPKCQGNLVVPAIAPDDPWLAAIPPPEDDIAICSTCKQATRFKPGKTPARPSDRILVNQLIPWQRWDIIVFRFPRDPTKKYVFRLVGLPGESIYIKEGAVWVNDIKQETPAELAGLSYTPIIGDVAGLTGHGTPEEPMRLGPNECFVLGDFPQRSSDSRDWGPVPVENIEGVACAIYWPMNRWKVFR